MLECRGKKNHKENMGWEDKDGYNSNSYHAGYFCSSVCNYSDFVFFNYLT